MSRPEDLPARPELPEPLGDLKGLSDEDLAEVWGAARRPALMSLFQYYEYGGMPGQPASLQYKVLYENSRALSGDAIIRELEVSTTVPTVSFRLLTICPNMVRTPAACFVGLNFSGNHRVVDDPRIHVTPAWVDERFEEWDGLRELGQVQSPWLVEKCLQRGYALATLYYGEVVPDRSDLAEERLRGIRDELDGRKRESEREGADTGSLAMWAWALSRAVDVLSEDPAIDPRRIAVVGHSRNGKAALLAAAFDTRFAMVVAHQAGCGGPAPNRVPSALADEGDSGRPRVETVAAITRAFPHWFCPAFGYFGGRVDYLPFDQHELIALCAPRPVLLSNGAEDEWANPWGQFAMLKAADPVFRLLTGQNAAPAAAPDLAALSASRLGWFLRKGGHSVVDDDWEAWLSYADVWL
jgi:hypothetical protein